MPTENEEQFSEAALAELASDHLSHSPPDDDGSITIWAFAEPASTATPLGSAVLTVADRFLKLPLREDAGVNTDSQGYIRTFFLEGLKWPAATWDHWIEKFPRSGVAKPEWCAAFGSYCVRTAYQAAAKQLPARLCGSASDLASKYEAAGRLLRREKLFAEDGAIRAAAELVPGPGDLVVFKGHVGILRELYADGTFVTIEGNTYKGSPRHDGVYQCNRSSTEKRADGTFKLVGFCLLASMDGVPAQPAAADSTEPAEPAKEEPAKEEPASTPPPELPATPAGVSSPVGPLDAAATTDKVRPGPQCRSQGR